MEWNRRRTTCQVGEKPRHPPSQVHQHPHGHDNGTEEAQVVLPTWCVAGAGTLKSSMMHILCICHHPSLYDTKVTSFAPWFRSRNASAAGHDTKAASWVMVTSRVAARDKATTTGTFRKWGHEVVVGPQEGCAGACPRWGVANGRWLASPMAPKVAWADS